MQLTCWNTGSYSINVQKKLQLCMALKRAGCVGISVKGHSEWSNWWPCAFAYASSSLTDDAKRKIFPLLNKLLLWVISIADGHPVLSLLHPATDHQLCAPYRPRGWKDGISPLFRKSPFPKVHCFRVRDIVSGIRARVQSRVTVSRSRVSRVMVSMVRFRVRVSIPSE